MKNLPIFPSFTKQSVATAASALLLVGLSSLYADSTWSGGTGDWSSNLDPGWNGTGVPDAVGATAVFDGGAGTTTQDIGGGVTLGTIDRSGNSGSTRTITATEAITFDQDGAGSGFATISNSSTSSGAVRLSFSSASTLILADDLLLINTSPSTGSYSIASTGTLEGSGNVTFSNVLNDSAPIHLGANNTFTGNVLIEKGFVTVANNTGLGNAANAITLGSAGNSSTFYSTGSTTDFGNNITVVATTGTNRLGSNSTHASNNSEFSGTILLNGDVRLLSEKTGTAIVEFSNEISGTGSVAVEGQGAMHFSGINTYTGDTTLEGTGSLTLDDNAGLAFVIGASGVNNGISGTANQTLTLDGDFTFDLSGAAAVGSWNIVDVASLNETFGSNFQVNGFTEAANVWTFGNYSFSEATGVLTAVPEPSTWALIAAAGTIFVTLRRRKMA